MSNHIDINAAFELSQNLADVARTALSASHKLRELAEALKQHQGSGWQPASAPPPEHAYVAGVLTVPGDVPELACIIRHGSRWFHADGSGIDAPTMWCHLPKGVVS